MCGGGGIVWCWGIWETSVVTDFYSEGVYGSGLGDGILWWCSSWLTELFGDALYENGL